MEKYFSSLNGYKVKDAEAHEKINTLSLRGRNFILVGDSFSGGIISANERGKGWIAHFKDYVSGMCNVYKCEAQLQGVAGFASSMTFLSMIQGCIIEDNLSITDIVVLGGTNDLPVADGVENAIAEFMEYCKETYPNATVKIGLVGTPIKQFYSILEKEYSKCRKYGAVYVRDTMCLMCDTSFISDGTHLTQEGYDFYDPFIADVIINGKCDYTFKFQCSIGNTSFNDNQYFTFIVNKDGYSMSYTDNNTIPKYKTISHVVSSANAYNLPIGTLNGVPKLPIYDTRLTEGFAFETLVSNGNYITSSTRPFSIYLDSENCLTASFAAPCYDDTGKTIEIPLFENTKFVRI